MIVILLKIYYIKNKIISKKEMALSKNDKKQ